MCRYSATAAAAATTIPPTSSSGTLASVTFNVTRTSVNANYKLSPSVNTTGIIVTISSIIVTKAN